MDKTPSIDFNDDKRRIELFIQGLEELYERTGLRISDRSCGCCGRTTLYDSDTNEELINVDENWGDNPFGKVLT